MDRSRPIRIRWPILRADWLPRFRGSSPANGVDSVDSVVWGVHSERTMGLMIRAGSISDETRRLVTYFLSTETGVTRREGRQALINGGFQGRDRCR